MEKLLVLDFGGQYNQLIARRVREMHVYCDILPYTASARQIAEGGYRGVIFTGGPASVGLSDSPVCSPEIFSLGLPVLGICYGAQIMARLLGGEIRQDTGGEYGRVSCRVQAPQSALFLGVARESTVWMSHADSIVRPPRGFTVTAVTDACPCAAMEDSSRGLYAVQFHPEVTHTEFGGEILKNFVLSVCGCRGDWHMEDFIDRTVAELRERIGDKPVILGISGGVDSAVAAALLSRAVGRQLTGVFVDHGLMRKHEGDEVETIFSGLFPMRFVRVNCADVFWEKLRGVTDPEQKRKIIGDEFYKVFWGEIKSRAGGDAFFAQGTIYPDRVESGRGVSGGKAGNAVIKTHHNQQSIPKDVQFLGVVEPLRDLFKDEVRKVGEMLGVPKSLVWRQPFPGPGLGVRVVGEITPEKVRILQDADFILRDEMRKTGYEEQLSQFFCVFTGAKSVGVMGDHRTYENVIAIRAVTTDDFMTADWARIPYELLASVSNRIINECPGVNRVVYDITSKPPGTVEWE